MTVAPCTGLSVRPATPAAGLDRSRPDLTGQARVGLCINIRGTPDTGREPTQYRKGSGGMSTIAVIGATGTAGSLVTNKLKRQNVTGVQISRSHGVDLISVQGLSEALHGVDLAVDCSHPL